MLVRNRMSRKVVATTADRRLADIRATLQARNIRQLPVVAGSRVIGIVTDRDLRSANSSATVVADIMSRNALVIAPGASVDEAAHVLRDRKINALPVVEDRRLVGIITASDILDAFIDLTGVAEPSYRLILSSPGGAGRCGVIRRIVEDHDGELKWTHLEGGTKRGTIHVRLKTRRLDDVTTALESAGFDVRATVSTVSVPRYRARRTRTARQ